MANAVMCHINLYKKKEEEQEVERIMEDKNFYKC